MAFVLILSLLVLSIYSRARLMVCCHYGCFCCCYTHFYAKQQRTPNRFPCIHFHLSIHEWQWTSIWISWMLFAFELNLRARISIVLWIVRCAKCCVAAAMPRKSENGAEKYKWNEMAWVRMKKCEVVGSVSEWVRVSAAKGWICKFQVTQNGKWREH